MNKILPDGSIEISADTTVQAMCPFCNVHSSAQLIMQFITVNDSIRLNCDHALAFRGGGPLLSTVVFRNDNGDIEHVMCD